MDAFLAGGDCAEDIGEHLKSDLLQILNLKVCSADTIGQVLKSLSQEKEIHLSSNGIEHQLSSRENLNAMIFILTVNLFLVKSMILKRVIK